MSNQRRKAEVARMREEGRQAARSGKSRQSNPYRDMNRYQWLSGYDAEKVAMDLEQALPLKDVIL